MPPEYSTPPPKTSIPHEFSTPPSHTFIPPTSSTPPPKTSPLHVIPPLSPTSPALEAALPTKTSPTSLPVLGACPLRRPRAPCICQVVRHQLHQIHLRLHMLLQIIWLCILGVLRERQSLHHVGLIDVYLYLYILLFVIHYLYIYMTWFIYEMINCCVLVVISMHLG